MDLSQVLKFLALVCMISCGDCYHLKEQHGDQARFFGVANSNLCILFYYYIRAFTITRHPLSSFLIFFFKKSGKAGNEFFIYYHPPPAFNKKIDFLKIQNYLNM